MDNTDIMERCRVLKDYSIFVGKIKSYQKKFSLKYAINRAVEECIQEAVLRDVLLKHKKEVYDMCLTEFDEKKYEDVVRAEGRAEGLEEGLAIGNINAIRNMIDLGLTKDQILRKCTEEEYAQAESSLLVHS